MPLVYAYEPRPDAFTQTMNCGSCQFGIGTPNVRSSHARPTFMLLYCQFRGMHGEQSNDRGFGYNDVMKRVGHADGKFPVVVLLASLTFLQADDSA